MTIASEIERLQTAKACIKASLESKGVSVPSDLTLEGYYCCVDSINVMNVRYFDYLLIGGGGAGGCYCLGYGGGGGAGGVLCKIGYKTIDDNFQITIGAGGQLYGNNGGDSKIVSEWCTLVAYGGGGGGNGGWGGGKAGGSGGGGGSCNSGGGAGCSGQGYNGGRGCCAYQSSGGGGGAGGAGGAPCAFTGGCGGPGITTDFTGKSETFAKGGNGNGNSVGTNRGNGGSYDCAGISGIAVIRYKTDGSCGINSATGGCKYICGDYTIHCFTSNGTFCITG